MKYGESAFDILYLLFAVISGVVILLRAKDRAGKLMGAASLILGCGDAFHLVPRVLNYFSAADLTAALGIGKLVTSLTMTVFYVLLYYVWIERFRVPENRRLTAILWGLAVIRAALCLFPQNGWLQNSNSVGWGILRNIPFVILGAAVCWLFFTRRKEDMLFRSVWLYILLSFLFYIPVATAAGIVPILGMLMLPKTVCYILMICVFLKALKGSAKA